MCSCIKMEIKCGMYQIKRICTFENIKFNIISHKQPLCYAIAMHSENCCYIACTADYCIGLRILKHGFLWHSVNSNFQMKLHGLKYSEIKVQKSHFFPISIIKIVWQLYKFYGHKWYRGWSLEEH